MDQPLGNSNSSTYKGSYLFNSVASTAGLPIDQFNFLFSEILALILGIVFRRLLPPKPGNTLSRHLVASVVGIALGYFCFGTEIWHLFAQSSVVYLMLYFVPAAYSHLAIFAFCMIYLSAIHIHRLIYDYGNYTLDISGPLMVNTQKLTALGFAFYDGYRAKRAQSKSSSPLNADQEKQKIVDIPSPIEFLSYIFYFHGIIVGPLCFFRDYINYIDGSNLQVIPSSSTRPTTTTTSTKKVAVQQPSTFWPVTTKLGQCAIWGYVLLFLTPKYTIEYNLSQEMVNSVWVKRLSYLLLSTFCTRGKYYFAFLLSEAVNNAAGLGFNGYDEKNPAVPRWNLVTNIKPFELERATSLKVVFDLWNMQTSLWLRRVCYDRMTSGRTLGVFVLSAIWHGFYPGYYICFILAAIETYAGRGIRRQIRPHFQKSEVTIAIYAALTWLGTQIALNFAVTPFVLLEVRKSWYFYQSWYFTVPIIGIVLALTLNGASSKKAKPGEQAQAKERKKSS